MNKKPSFLVLGAPKCGTTSLYQYLNQHPDLFLCPKETHYFIRNDKGYSKILTSDWDSYLKLFFTAKEFQSCGEVAVRYVYSQNAMKEIKNRLPDCKLIVFLREPVERAFSHYLMRFRTGGIQSEGGGVHPSEAEITDYFSNTKRDVIQWSCYAKYLRPWYEEFRPEQIAIYLLEDLRERPKEVLSSILEFIDVSSDFDFDVRKRYNVSTQADFNSLVVRLKRIKILRNLRSSRLLRRYVGFILPRKIRDWLVWRGQKQSSHIQEKIEMPEKVRLSLLRFFSKERDELAKLTSHDFSKWPRA